MRPLLRIIESSRLPEKQKSELRLLHGIDRAIASSCYRGKKGLAWFRAFLGKYALVVIILLSFGVPLLMGLFDGELDGEREDEELTQEDREMAIFLTLFLFVMMGALEGNFQETGSKLGLDKLNTTPVSRDSVALYQRLRVNINRVEHYLSISVLIMVFFHVIYPLSFLELVGHSLKLFCCFMVALALVATWLGSYNIHVPETSKREIWGARLALIFILPPFLLLGLAILDGLLRGGAMEESLPYVLELPLTRAYLFFHLTTAEIALGFVDTWKSVVFLSIGLILLVPGELLYCRLLRKTKVVGYKPPEYIREQARKRLERHIATREKKKEKGSDPGSTKDIRDLVFPKGFEALYSYQLLKEGGGSMEIFLMVALGSCMLFSYLLLPAIGLMCLVFFHVLVCSLLIKSPFPGFSRKLNIIRLIPAKPEKVVDDFFHRLFKSHARVYLYWALPLAALSLLTIHLPYQRFFLEPYPFLTVYVLSVIPLLLLSYHLLTLTCIGIAEMPKKWKRRWEALFILLSLLLSAYGTRIFTREEAISGSYFLDWLLHMGIAACLVFAGWHALRMRLMDYLHGNRYYRDMEKTGPAKPRPGHPTPGSLRAGITGALSLAVVLMLLSLSVPGALVVLEGGVSEVAQVSRGPIPYDHAEVFSSEIYITNTTRYFEESLIIEKNTTTISNSTIVFNNSKAGAEGLYIKGSGKFILDNSTLTSRSYFNFEIHGDVLVKNSDISRVMGNYRQMDKDGGIEVYSGSRYEQVLFWNSSIHHCKTNGFMIFYCDPTIEKCDIYDIGDDAIEIHGGGPVIDNCTIRDARRGINVRVSDPWILNTEFSDIQRKEIKLGHDADPHFVGTDYDHREWNGVDSYFGPYVVSLLLVLLTLLLVIKPGKSWKKKQEKQRKKKEEEKEGGGTGK